MKQEKRLIDTINRFIDTGEYDLGMLYTPGELQTFTEKSLHELALSFLYYYSGKGLTTAKRRKGNAIASMRAFVKKDINPVEDWQRSILQKKITFNWSDMNKEYLLKNKILSGSSIFYQEQMRDHITSDQKQRLNIVLPLLHIEGNDHIIEQILHGVGTIE